MRSVARILFLALALALLGLALTPTASPAQGTDPCSPERLIPYWWHLSPWQPCGGDSVTLVFGSCRDCVEILGYEWLDTGGLRLELRARDVCPVMPVCRPDSIEVPLGVLAAGFHMLLVEVHAGVVYGDSGFCYVTRHDSITFAIGCPPPPPPPPPPPDSLLPWVHTIRIGPPSPCLECRPRICPDLPIPFFVAGVFPTNCLRFEKLELLPSDIVGPGPEPPIVRIVVAQNDCMRWPCADMEVPWAADTLLPPLPSGVYNLMLQLAVVSMCDSSRVDTTYYATRAFTVLDSCNVIPPRPCLIAGWDHSGRTGMCDAFVAPDRPAKVAMTLMTQVPLAGLQGKLSLFPAGLRITGLEPLGPAQGMHLVWQPTADGASFVMFAEHGAPIPVVRCDPGTRCEQPVLGVTLLPGPGVEPPPVTHLYAHHLLGSDSLGLAVPECPIQTLVLVSADICGGPSCDFNLDGYLDVRDLVTMVHCILGNGPCPDTSLARLDCNGDSRLNLDDVLCCAGVILRGGERDTMPGRPEPDVAVSFGDAAWGPRGLEVPVTLFGADHVGAARLALDFPQDRYDVAAVELGTGTGQWLELHQMVDGQLVVGLIGLGAGTGTQSAQPASPTQVGLTLRLTLKPGQGAGGELRLADGQFSGPDGATLDVPYRPGSVPLPSPGALALGAARPNPFARETRFSLNLDRRADVEVAIHDLSGRLVTTLFRGPLEAGPHEFTWRGAQGDGSAAANGVYFVQVRVGEERLARKLVFLRGE